MTGTIRFAGGTVVVDGSLEQLDVVVADGRITALEPPTRPLTRPPDPIWVGISSDSESIPTEIGEDVIVDCADTVIAPGFIDLQCNGAGGVDITTTPERLADVGRELTRFGVTAYLPTVVTAPPRTRQRAIAAMAALADEEWGPGDGAVALGLHFEGPAISPQHVGAHPAHLVAVPDRDEVGTWIDSGVVRLVTVAPEVDGVLPLIAQLAEAGVTVSAGHTAMSPGVFVEARRVGVTYVTHLYNAMQAFSHRAPGPIGAVLADDDVTVGVICDGIHIDPVAVKVAWHALGPRRLSLVSDAAPPLGGEFGTYVLGGFEVVYDDSGVRTRDGVLAGSALALDRAVRNLVEYTGCSLPDALATVTSTPADLLGLADRGRVAVGNRADLTILDHVGHLRATVVAGSIEWAGTPGSR